MTQLKAPSPQNRLRLKRFLMQNPWWPHSKAMLTRIVLEETEIAERSAHPEKRMEEFKHELDTPKSTI